MKKLSLLLLSLMVIGSGYAQEHGKQKSFGKSVIDTIKNSDYQKKAQVSLLLGIPVASFGAYCNMQGNRFEKEANFYASQERFWAKEVQRENDPIWKTRLIEICNGHKRKAQGFESKAIAMAQKTLRSSLIAGGLLAFGLYNYQKSKLSKQTIA